MSRSLQSYRAILCCPRKPLTGTVSVTGGSGNTTTQMLAPVFTRPTSRNKQRWRTQVYPKKQAMYPDHQRFCSITSL